MIYENNSIDNNNINESIDEYNKNFEYENYISNLKDNELNVDEVMNILDNLSVKDNKELVNEEIKAIELEEKERAKFPFEDDKNTNTEMDVENSINNKVEINTTEPLLKRVEKRIKKQNNYQKNKNGISKDMIELLKYMNLELKTPQKRKKDDLEDLQDESVRAKDNNGFRKKGWI